MKITVQALSSSGGSYPVEFTDEGGSLRVFCHCNAGVMQQMCKHKAALIQGDTKMLFTPSEAPLLKRVMESLAYPVLKAHFERYENDLALVTREMAKLKEKEKLIKKGFAHELVSGKPN